MDAEVIKLILTGIAGGVGGYLLKWVDFRRQYNKERRVELRNDLKELHVSVLEVMSRIVTLSLEVNQFIHGEMPDAGAITAIERLGRPCREMMVKTTSLQRRCALEYMDTWVPVVQEMEACFLIIGNIMIGTASMSDLEYSVKTIRRNGSAFLLCVEEKLNKS